MTILHRCIRSLAPAGWAIFLGWLLTGGRAHLMRLLHPGLWWLVACGMVIFLLFAVTGLLRRTPLPSRPLLISLMQAAILLLPLIYFPLVTTASFGTLALEKRGILPDAGAIADPWPALESRSTAPKSGEITTLLDLLSNASQHQGQSVEISAMVFREDKLPDDVFIAYRFLMTCCAADARPLVAMVRYSSARELPADSWVRIRGSFSLVEKEGVPIPTIQAEEVEIIEEPASPFLF